MNTQENQKTSNERTPSEQEAFEQGASLMAALLHDDGICDFEKATRQCQRQNPYPKNSTERAAFLNGVDYAFIKGDYVWFGAEEDR
jgi:hypothetical protein